MTSMRRRATKGAAVAALLWVVGCAASSSPPAPSSLDFEAGMASSEAEELALLLLLADRRVFDAFTLERSLAGGSAVRSFAALAAGRIGDARSLPLLEALSFDDDARVRRASVHSMGRLESPEARLLLFERLGDEDPEVAALAVRGLARMGVELSAVLRRLEAFAPEDRRRRVLPELHCFSGPLVELTAREGLASPSPWLRRRALEVLTTPPTEGRLDLYRSALQEDDDEARALVARALGEVGDASDLDRLGDLAESSVAESVVASVGAAARIVERGKAAPTADWRRRLVGLMGDERAPVRAAAVVAAGRWLLDDEIEAILRERVRSGAERERVLATRALAGGRSALAVDVVHQAAIAPAPALRAEAAVSGALLGIWPLVRELAGDPSPMVRAAALHCLAGPRVDVLPSIEAWLADADPGVRAAGLARAADEPVVAYSRLVEALVAGEAEVPALGPNGVAALLARARAEPSEKALVVDGLASLVDSRLPYATRSAAARALRALAASPSQPGAATTDRSAADYRSVVLRTRRPRWLEMETVRGRFTVRLDCQSSPLSCLSFVQLARQGFFDDQRLDDVEPGVRLEAGDPRGDGWGGPGYELRDEPTPERFPAGSLYLVRPAPHAAGSRFGITLRDSPALEADHTLLGRVVSGFGVVRRLIEGDLLLAVREVPEAAVHSPPDTS